MRERIVDALQHITCRSAQSVHQRIAFVSISCSTSHTCKFYVCCTKAHRSLSLRLVKAQRTQLWGGCTATKQGTEHYYTQISHVDAKALIFNSSRSQRKGRGRWHGPPSEGRS